jgi:hypothetical protein
MLVCRKSPAFERLNSLHRSLIQPGDHGRPVRQPGQRARLQLLMQCQVLAHSPPVAVAGVVLAAGSPAGFRVGLGDRQGLAAGATDHPAIHTSKTLALRGRTQPLFRRQPTPTSSQVVACQIHPAIPDRPGIDPVPTESGYIPNPRVCVNCSFFRQSWQFG